MDNKKKKSSEPPEETTPPLVIEPAGPEEGTEVIVKLKKDKTE